MANNPEQPENAGSAASSSQETDTAKAGPEWLEAAASTPDAPSTPDAEFRPKGAFRFVVVLIIGYAIYFFLTWHEIVILRGGA
ncbi:MAG TPA: hypothetical protein VKY59_07020 [Spirillospora sp.]|nr:hypothetical protein [Spirillospora sp.]